MEVQSENINLESKEKRITIQSKLVLGQTGTPVLYPAHVCGLLLHYYREQESHPIPHGKAVAAPMGLLDLGHG